MFSECLTAYPLIIASSMVCAGGVSGEGSCQGDVGGPLVDKSKTHVGIDSWGLGCARPGKPGVYTQTSYFIDWIERNRY
jgi:secreted trypsin-like serine protease